MDPNPNAGTGGNTLTLTAGSAANGATDKPGGDLILAAGNGTGLGASGNARIQTAGAATASGTGGDTRTDRIIVVGKAKPLASGIALLFSITLTGTQSTGGRVIYTIRSTDGGSQEPTETATIKYVGTPNGVSCQNAVSDKLTLGTVNSGCTLEFVTGGFSIGITDNVSFPTPAPVVVNEVYFTIENESGSPIRLEP
jgi:hypothetical protein